MDVEEEKFVLRATPSVKKYNVARFDGKFPQFQEWKAPVLMVREAEAEESEEEKDDDEVPGNMAFRKRRRRRRKSTRTPGWNIKDGEAKQQYNGSLEGGQSGSYILLTKVSDSEFSVVPIEQWFRFKKPLNYRTLTLEEAEEVNNEKKRKVERWLMKHKLAGAAEDGKDTISTQRIRTGAAVVRPIQSTESTDIFEVKSASKKTRKAKNTEGDPDGVDGGDFTEKFDDDESETEITGNVAGAVSSSDTEDEEGPGASKLSATGQAMKDLLKRAQQGDMEEKKTKSSDSEDEAEGEEGGEVMYDLGGNKIKTRESATTDEHGKPAEGGTAGQKRSRPDGGSSAPPAKAARTGTQDPPRTTSVSKLTEASVQQELIRYGGRMKTRELLKKFKKLLVTADDKALFRDILRTICTVETDPIDGRILVLKSHFL